MILWVGLEVFSVPEHSLANPDFTKRTAKKCVYCHVDEWTSGKYTQAGRYFKFTIPSKATFHKKPLPSKL